MAVLAVLVVALLAWIVWFSSFLDTRTVEVEGLTTLGADQVRAVAEVPLGGPLARVDTDAVEERLQKRPRIRSVEVTRSWPHTVTISVVEREAVVWSREAGEIRGIDRFGIDYRSFAKVPAGLIEADIQATDADVRLETTRAIAEVAQDLRTEKPSWLGRVRAITGSTQDDVTIEMKSGRTIVWGSADQTKRKLGVLRTLLRIDARGYDVSAPDQPTTRD